MKSFDSVIGTVARAAMRGDSRIRGLASGIVPEAAFEHILFCRHADNQLHVTLDSAVWIPKLRYCERKLLAALIRDGLMTRSIRWHVSPAEVPRGRQTRQRAAQRGTDASQHVVMSAASEATAAGNADSADDDALSRALLRMASNLRSTD